MFHYSHNIINTHILPPIVCIGLIWDSDSPPISYIMDVIQSIGLTLHLNVVSVYIICLKHVLSPYSFTHYTCKTRDVVLAAMLYEVCSPET